MYRIRRFGVVRTASVLTVMYLLVFGVFLLFFVLLFGAASSTMTTTFPGGTQSVEIPGPNIVGLFAGLLFALVLYGVATWVFTALACLLYNFVCRWVGGIEIQLEAAPPPLPDSTLAAGWGAPPPGPPAGWGLPPSGPPAGPSAPWQQPGNQPGYQPWNSPPGRSSTPGEPQEPGGPG